MFWLKYEAAGFLNAAIMLTQQRREQCREQLNSKHERWAEEHSFSAVNNISLKGFAKVLILITALKSPIRAPGWWIKHWTYVKGQNLMQETEDLVFWKRSFARWNLREVQYVVTFSSTGGTTNWFFSYKIRRCSYLHPSWLCPLWWKKTRSVK